MRDYDLGKSTLDPLDERVHACGSAAAADNRTSEQNRLIGCEAREREAQDGGRCLKTSGADIRTKVTVIRRTPAATRYQRSAASSAAPRSTYYHMLANPPAPPAPDPIEPDVLGAFGASRGGCWRPQAQGGAREVGDNGLQAQDMQDIEAESPVQRVSGRRPGASRPAAPPDAANVLGRGFDGHRPRTHVAADLTYVRAGIALVLRLPARRPVQREIVGCSCGRRKDASLVKAAFSNVEFPLTGIEVFHSDRGARICNAEIDAILTAFGIDRSVSRPGNPHDNAVVESTNHILKRELVAGRRFASEEELRAALFDWVNWYNNFRIHSTLGYMSPVEFREAGLILS